MLTVLKQRDTQHFNRKKLQALSLLLLVVGSTFYAFLTPNKAQGAVTLAYYKPDRMKADTAANGSVSGNICLKTGTSGTESSATVVFPSTWTLDTTLSAWTLDTTANNIPPGTTQWPSTGSGDATAANNGTHTVTWTVGNLASGATTYCFHFTATGSTTTSVTGTDQTGTIATDVDSAYTYATSQTTNDQLSVTATVSQIFSFSLTAGAHSLTLTPGGSTVSSGTASSGSIGTNAPNGYFAWVKSSNGALHSTVLGSGSDITAGSFAAGSNTVDLASTTGYVLDCQDTAGTGCATGVDFNGNGTTSGGKLPTTFKVLANKTSPTTADTFTLKVRAKVAVSQQPAADYADTITVDAAGQF
jgi:hypothetical protein